MTRRIASVLILLFAFASIVATAQTVKKTSISPTPASSGPEMFKSYCASCHGVDGKGAGPAASALKVSPVNLTQLARNSGGKFPAAKVYAAVKGDANNPAHGSKDMPVWGAVFQTMSHGDQGQVQLRISNLTKYIESLQAN